MQALKDASLDFIAMRGFAMRFRGIMDSGDIEKLATWIDDVLRSGIYAMQRFGRSLRAEGQINTLKTLKPAMYGRAGVELLQARMLPLHQPNSHMV